MLANRERAVMVEPRGGGMLMRVLRSADEVRSAEFGEADGHANPDMVTVAETIIERRAGKLDPREIRDRYQDALRELVENKAEGRPMVKKKADEAPKVINLMEALKRSLAQNHTKSAGEVKSALKSKPAADRRQAHLLLPVSGGKAGGKTTEKPAAKPARTPAAKTRKKAS